MAHKRNTRQNKRLSFEPDHAEDDLLIQKVCDKMLNSDAFAQKLADKIFIFMEDKLKNMCNDLSKKYNNLEKRVTEIENDNQDLCDAYDQLEQKSRSNNVRIYGAEASERSNPMEAVQKIFSEKLNVDVPETYIVSVIKLPGTERNTKPLLVTFSNHKYKVDILKQVKKLKGSGISIREDLSRTRAAIVKDAVAKFGSRSVWTRDGRIFINTGDRIHKILNIRYYKEIVAKHLV